MKYYHVVFTLPAQIAGISNSRPIALDDKQVTFKWKDYRAPGAPEIQDHGPADT